jgi:exopolysaccharide biosynthesis predicted pyruvyltransferase EpsI
MGRRGKPWQHPLSEQLVGTEMTDIYEFLKQYRGRKITYIPNAGNAGDSLIACATLQVFDELGLDYHIGKSREYRDALLFLPGGGTLVGRYDHLSNFLFRHNNKDNNEIVILPHTIREEDWLVSWLQNNVTVICRDRRSYDYVKGIRRRGPTLIAHDMGMCLKPPLFGQGRGILNCFRLDAERTDVMPPPDNEDISELYRQEDGCCDPETIKSVTFDLLKHVARFETINTNLRLSIPIACMWLLPGRCWVVKSISTGTSIGRT